MWDRMREKNARTAETEKVQQHKPLGVRSAKKGTESLVIPMDRPEGAEKEWDTAGLCGGWTKGDRPAFKVRTGPTQHINLLTDKKLQNSSGVMRAPKKKALFENNPHQTYR